MMLYTPYPKGRRIKSERSATVPLARVVCILYSQVRSLLLGGPKITVLGRPVKNNTKT